MILGSSKNAATTISDPSNIIHFWRIRSRYNGILGGYNQIHEIETIPTTISTKKSIYFNNIVNEVKYLTFFQGIAPFEPPISHIYATLLLDISSSLSKNQYSGVVARERILPYSSSSSTSVHKQYKTPCLKTLTLVLNKHKFLTFLTCFISSS